MIKCKCGFSAKKPSQFKKHQPDPNFRNSELVTCMDCETSFNCVTDDEGKTWRKLERADFKKYFIPFLFCVILIAYRLLNG